MISACMEIFSVLFCTLTWHVLVFFAWKMVFNHCFLIVGYEQNIMSMRKPNEGIAEHKNEEKAPSAPEQENKPTMTSYDPLTVITYSCKPRTEEFGGTHMPVTMNIKARQNNLRVWFTPVSQGVGVRQRSIRAEHMHVREAQAPNIEAYNPVLTVINWTVTPRQNALQVGLTAVRCP